MKTKTKKLRTFFIWLAALPVILLALCFCLGTSSPDEIEKEESESKIFLPALSATSKPYENASASDWNLVLVNADNPIKGDLDITLTQLIDGHSIDSRCYPDLQDMMDDCRAQGLYPIICSSYRTHEFQQTLYDKKVNSLIAVGYSEQEAKIQAAEVVAIPGTSEHELGLALDIVDENNQNLDETQEDTPVQKWLFENSWKYGFALRYPENKSDITGIIYEPWHYRYVGKDAAQYMYENDLCLEEYLELVGE